MQAESAASILKKISSATKYPPERQQLIGIVSASGIYINTLSKRLDWDVPFRITRSKTHLLMDGVFTRPAAYWDYVEFVTIVR